MKLRDICEKATSNIAQKDITDRSGIYPIYGASGFIKNIDSYAMNTPYIGIVKDGAGVGRVMLLPAKSSVIGTMQYIIPKKSIDIAFLRYLLESLDLSKYSTGATIPHIYFKDYGNEQVKKYSKTEQQRIADELDMVSGLIEKRQKQLEKLDLLIKSRFVEMFGNSLINNKHWDMVKLEDIAEVCSSRRVFVEELISKGIPFYRGTEIGALAEGREIIPELFISESHFRKLCNFTGAPKTGDLLMPSICPDGRIWIVNTTNPFYFKDGRVLWIRNLKEGYNSTFLRYMLKDRITTDYAGIASGTTFPELKIFALKKCNIFEVPPKLQNQFADFVEKVEQNKAKIKTSLNELNTLKKALMQKYFG